jgi:hypothetical protein
MKLHGERILALLPCVLLVSVAALNFVLVKRNDFSIWYGGSFGMFASLDGPATRYLTVTYVNDTGLTKVNLADYETEVTRIKTNLSTGRIEKLLRELCETQHSKINQLSSTLHKLSYEPATQTVTPVLWKEVTIGCF